MEEPLYSSCPVVNCPNNQNNFHTYWYHHNCGGRTKIRYDDITLVCEKCPSSRSIMFDWLFNCGAHDFQKGSAQGWLFALGVMGQQKGNLEYIKKAIKRIGESL